MAQFKPPAYPDILTASNWNKKKGAIAKLAGETGLGDLMRKSESAYNAIKWIDIDVFKYMPLSGAAKTADSPEKAFQQAMQGCAGTLRALELALIAVNKKAETTAVEWKKNKLIPSDSTKHALAVAAAADTLRNALAVGTVNEFLKGQRAQAVKDVETARAIEANGLKMLKKYVDGFEDAVKTANFQPDKYNSLWSENIRGVGTQLAPLAKSRPEFATEYNIWRNYSNSEKTPKSTEEFKQQIEVMRKVLKVLGPKLDKLG